MNIGGNEIWAKKLSAVCSHLIWRLITGNFMVVRTLSIVGQGIALNYKVHEKWQSEIRLYLIGDLCATTIPTHIVYWISVEDKLNCLSQPKCNEARIFWYLRVWDVILRWWSDSYWLETSVVKYWVLGKILFLDSATFSEDFFLEVKTGMTSIGYVLAR